MYYYAVMTSLLCIIVYLLLPIITKSLLCIIKSLLHHYFIIIISLLLYYYLWLEQVKMSSLLHCYYPLLPLLPIITSWTYMLPTGQLADAKLEGLHSYMLFLGMWFSQEQTLSLKTQRKDTNEILQIWWIWLLVCCWSWTHLWSKIPQCHIGFQHSQLLLWLKGCRQAQQSCCLVAYNLYERMNVWVEAANQGVIARWRQGKCQVCFFLFSLVLEFGWTSLSLRVCLDHGLFETKSHCSTTAVAMELMDCCSRKIWRKFEEWFFSGEGKRCAGYVSSGGLNVWR